ncbi:hypothetical protein PG996_013494 [Apiospora saccharicola]|uniref:Uncharacterized protein n=1 Tax=Apiospora saccharicola TaxID=335842 RepID=A0ABR1U5L8_9PEZI
MPDEQSKRLLKVVFGTESRRRDDGWTPMAKAEFEPQNALSEIIRDNVVEPVAWTVFEKDSKAFFMTKFRALQAIPPSPPQLVKILKSLHQESSSPTGKFGFHTTTYWGPPAMVNG